MQTYIVTRYADTLARIQANNPEAAANRTARKLYGRDAAAKRQTGKTGQAGDFQPSGAQANGADMFHVAVAGAGETPIAPKPETATFVSARPVMVNGNKQKEQPLTLSLFD